MKTLALEFSSATRSVAVVEDGQVRSQAREIEAGETRAFHMIESVLREAGLEREAIDCVAVGLGPGSYTGIRMAIALAQGWQLAHPVNLQGVSSVDCLAAQAQAEKIYGRVHIVVDAQRNELYLRAYEIDSKAWRPAEALRLASLAEVKEREAGGGIVVGPEVGRWFPSGCVICPAAAALGMLAARRSDFVPATALEPIYLREARFVKAPPPRIPPA